MEYVEGGEFFHLLQLSGKLPENVVKFVAAEVVLALDYLNNTLKVFFMKPYTFRLFIET